MVSPSGTILVKKSDGADWSEEILDPGDIGAAIDAEVVKLVGDQTISGTKTFDSSPFVIPPTLAGHAVNKNYVDTVVAVKADYVLVESLSDFPTPVANKITLLDGYDYEINGIIELNTNSLVLGAGTAVYGQNPYQDILNYSGTSNVFETPASFEDKLILRNLGVGSSVSGSKVFNLLGVPGSSGVFELLNLVVGIHQEVYDLGLIQDIKHSFIQDNTFEHFHEGLTLSGAIEHCFVHHNYFDDIEPGVSAALTVQVSGSTIEITNNHFHVDTGREHLSIPTTVSGQIDLANVVGNSFHGGGIPLAGGLSISNIDWNFQGNIGIPNSQAVGGFTISGTVETVISAINTPVKVLGTTVESETISRFEMPTDNRIVYIGKEDALVTIIVNFTATGDNNVNINLYINHNGSTILSSKGAVKMGSGSDERTGTSTAILTVSTGDTIEIWGENAVNTTNFTVEVLSVVLRD